MNKRGMIVIIILLCVVILFLCSFTFIKTESQSIHVIDHETGLPLPDFYVYYQLQKTRGVWFVEVRHITMRIKKLKTDNNGKITIPARYYLLLRNEELSNISFFINIGNKNNKIPRDSDLLKFSDCFPNKGIIDTDITLVNKDYSATAVFIFNYNTGREESNISSGFFRYELDKPFNKDFFLIVHLARNKN